MARQRPVRLLELLLRAGLRIMGSGAYNAVGQG